MNAPASTARLARVERPTERQAEQLAGGEQRKEDRAGDRQHQHLRAQPGAAAVGDEHAPGRREAKRRVIEHEAGADANQEQHRLPRRDGHAEIRDAEERWRRA